VSIEPQAVIIFTIYSHMRDATCFFSSTFLNPGKTFLLGEVKTHFKALSLITGIIR